MVEEALVAALAEQVQPTNGDHGVVGGGVTLSLLDYAQTYATMASEWSDNDDEIDKHRARQFPRVEDIGSGGRFRCVSDG